MWKARYLERFNETSTYFLLPPTLRAVIAIHCRIYDIVRNLLNGKI